MGAKQCKLIESIDYSIPPCYPSDEELEKIKKHIVKHSKNIIDLIEVGDIVKVLDIDWIRVFNLDDKDFIEAFKEDLENGDWELLSIVTKEQFAQAEYKIEKGE